MVSSEVATAPEQEKRTRGMHMGIRDVQLTLCCCRRSKNPMWPPLGEENRWMASPNRGFRKTRCRERKWKVLKNIGAPPKATRLAVLNSRYFDRLPFSTSRNTLESDANSRYKKKDRHAPPGAGSGMTGIKREKSARAIPNGANVWFHGFLWSSPSTCLPICLRPGRWGGKWKVSL